MLSDLLSNLYLIALLSVIGSFIVTMFIIPKIIWIVNSLDLIDHPDDRSSHESSTPTMAGVSFFLTLVFAIFFIKIWDLDSVGINLTAALTLIFAVGLKDDLVMSSPRAKIGGEVIAIFFVLFCGCMQITSLEGFLGIQNIPTIVSYALIIIMILTIINSYNLIDGIDGLASTIGIVIFSVYALIFYETGLSFYFLLSLSLIGILCAFLRYNLSSTKKIFMGDTGSLIIGFCIGFLTLKFLSMDASLFSEFSFRPENKLIVIAAILFIPLFDTIRVIGVRLLNKKSPFYPDSNHIHHILIDSGLSHYKTSIFLGVLNVGLAVLFIFISSYFNSFQMITALIISFAFMLILFYKLKENIKSKNAFKHLISAIQILF
jgi:UDP-N-acetylmuramyl pentapeptide phosphotransferase/UDP-N-acetylglucosamine-1-phosphate transferase